MKKIKKHLIVLGVLLLFGIAALTLTANASANGFQLFGINRTVDPKSIQTSITKNADSRKQTTGNQLIGIQPISGGSISGAASTSSDSSDSGEEATDTQTSIQAGQSADGGQDVHPTAITGTSNGMPETKTGYTQYPSGGASHFIPGNQANKNSKSTSGSTSTKGSSSSGSSGSASSSGSSSTSSSTSSSSTSSSSSSSNTSSSSNDTPGSISGGGSMGISISSVSLDKTELEMKKGDSESLNATVSPKGATQSKTITWTSNDDKIASVDSTGKVTAVEGGAATITAKTINGKTATCKVTVDVPATKITLNLTDISLEKGDSRVLTPTVEPADSTEKVSWSTTNNDIVAVDTSGKITAVAPGTATITATAGKVTANCKVTVGISIAQLKLSENDITIKKGDNKTLTATIDPPDTTEDKKITWSSSDNSIASVDKDGNITGIENGTAIITAQAGTHTAQCTVHVHVPATGISLDKNELDVERGASQTLTAKLVPDDATVTDVDWVSTDETIATVDNNGKVTGVHTGSTVITVKSRDGGFTAHCTVHVVVSITNINLSDTKLTLNKGDTKVLTATVLPADTTEDKTVHWTSSDTGVVTVDSNGNLNAVEGGTVTITATAGKHTATCSVTVLVPVSGITLDKSSLTLIKGTGSVLKSTLQPADATDKGIAWTSSNSDIVTVDDSGNIKAISPGTATITATSHDGGFKANSTVTVVIPVTGISLNQSSLTLTKGNASILTVAITPTDATDKAVTWTSSNYNAVTVDSSGNISANGDGSAVITATSHDGKYSANCTVYVFVPVTGITINQSNLSLPTGGTANLQASIHPDDASNTAVTWSSSDSSLVTVDQSGNINVLGETGAAVITATSNDGKFTAQCNVAITNTPSAPVSLIASMIDDTTVKMTWNAPEKDGNSPITGYNVTINGVTSNTTANDYSFTCPSTTSLSITVSAGNINGLGKSATVIYDVTYYPQVTHTESYQSYDVIGSHEVWCCNPPEHMEWVDDYGWVTHEKTIVDKNAYYTIVLHSN